MNSLSMPTRRFMTGVIDRYRALILVVVIAMPAMTMAQLVENIEVNFAGAEQGDWGGKKGAAIGPPDGVCRNMGAVGKVNLVSGFDFNLPSDAVITDISAFIKAASQDGQNIGIQLATDASVNPPTGLSSLRLMASFNGDGGSCAETTFTTIDGSPNDWDLGADPYGPDPSTTVNAPEFGMVLEKVSTSEVKVDAICMQISYTTPGGEAVEEDCTESPPENTITLTKAVTNDNGGTAVDTDWTLTATGQTPTADVISGVTGDAAITNAAVKADDYVLTESSVTGYSPASSTALACLVTGTGSLNGITLTLNEGDAANCTFFNEDDQSTLTVTKVVNNEEGGTLMASDFALFIDATSVNSGEANNVDSGSYTVSETPIAGYSGSISGDCGSDGSVTLALGDSKECTITNTFLPPPIPVPSSNVWTMFLLTLMLLATGWYLRPAIVRRR